MGRRSRRRDGAPMPDAPTERITSADGTQALDLRTVLKPKTRAAYAAALHDQSASRDDAWHRAVEFLFERLVVCWEISGVPTEGQRDLLLRLRAATQDERRFVRDALRTHCAEWFPDVEAP
ncbi:unannotated protein [freshwater metagenome]|uniref:Unannotated protein n=1 Tax=freshwater metagenome TaxID=449393 RepID=A0A6J7J8J6_9ZZZZ